MIDLGKYTDFVAGVTSQASTDLDTLSDSLKKLESSGVNPALLMTAGIGLSGEVGEFCDIVKKCAFQGKALTPEVHTHMVSELSDIIWYWVNACRALNVDPNDVIQGNVNKLQARYPGGKFDATASANRLPTDI